MPLEKLINPINVTKAARFILEMDKCAIEEKMQPDVHDAIAWLQDSLEHYLHPVSGWSISGLNRMDYHEKQLKALIKDPSIRKELLDYSKLYKMNTKGVNLMQNPATGQQNLDIIPALMGHAGSALTGGAAFGLPGALAGLVAPGLVAKPLTNWMTSPQARQSLVKAMLEKNQRSFNPRYLQILGQSLANQNQNQ